ncbi:unnamed protein product, partial [Hydatigera taeniaeformis]|uniref:GTD-binding domain-containing protein n=1 Tax=Hydatigena taeniaeformis TaxID=6205 RepID=A0A0R3WYN0_HYDTA
MEEEKARIADAYERLSRSFVLLNGDGDSMRSFDFPLSISSSARGDLTVPFGGDLSSPFAISAHDYEMALKEIDELRHRVYVLEDDKARKSEECDRLISDLQLLSHKLRDLQSRVPSPSSVPVFPVVDFEKEDSMLSSSSPVLMESIPMNVNLHKSADKESSIVHVDEGLMAENMLRLMTIQSELDLERAKVGKLEERLAIMEAEKKAYLRNYDEVNDELKSRRSEQRSLEAKLQQMTGVKSREAEVAAMEIDALRHRVYDLEDEIARKSEECDRLLNELGLLTHEAKMNTSRKSPTLTVWPHSQGALLDDLREKTDEMESDTAHEGEVAAKELEEMCARLHDMEEEKARNVEECGRL